jgi:RHS repeat-associated protein
LRSNSVRQLADASGNIVQSYTYAPFGELLAAQGTRSSALQYTGEQNDLDTGLIYLRARWYDPATGRFTTRDPFPGFAVLPQTLHPYVYGLNNPVKYIDSGGHFPFIPLLIAGGILLFKAIDYGWTAHDAYQSGQTLADPNSSIEARLEAGVNLALTVSFEALEPDDLIPVGLPLDDVARAGVRAGVREALQNGGANAALRVVKDQLGSGAIRQLFDQGVFNGIRRYGEWDNLLMGVRKETGLEVHHLIEDQYKHLIGMAKDDIPAVVLDRMVHNGPASANSVTQLLAQSARRNAIGNAQDLWNHYKDVYGRLGHQDWLDAIWSIFENQGVIK